MFLRIYVVVIIVVFLSFLPHFHEMAATPEQLYECNDLNWVGVIILYGFFLVVDPLFFIFRFLYWLTHAGRKE